ncbi:MAG TPA: hypothetical protein VHE54_11295, partial [Puia sp.]|nr:hypothetical protein [Puia sp.]
QVIVPANYDFLPMLEAFRKYNFLFDLTKYRHNYDYRLTLLILNKKYYMTNGSILLTENESPFSPISVLHYQYYPNGGRKPDVETGGQSDIQCVVESGQRSGRSVPFGQAQQPGLQDYADGVDTMEFLRRL